MKLEDRRELRDQLRDAGLRATMPRVGVLSVLVGAEHPLSHAEVAEQLADQGFDRATVYRNLIDLTDAGLARRSDVGDHVWRFELVRGEHREEEHPHFVCTACGAVQCLPEGTIAVRPNRGLPRALKRGELEIRLRGVCDSCA